MTVSGRVAYGPSGTPLRVPRPSRGGGSPGPGGVVQGRHPLGHPPAFRGLGGGGGRGRGVAPWLPVPPLRSPGFFLLRLRGWLEGPGPGPPTAGSVVPRAAPQNVLRRDCLASLGAGRGPGVSCCWVSPCRHACPRAVRLAGGGKRRGTGGLGPSSGGRCPAGGQPGLLARTPLPPDFRPLGAGLSFGPFADGPLAPCIAAATSRVTGGWEQVRRALGAAARVTA